MLKSCVCGKEIYMETNQETGDVIILDSIPCKTGDYQRYVSYFGSVVAPTGEGVGQPREQYQLHPASLEHGLLHCSGRSERR